MRRQDVPQPIKALLGEIGEKLVLYRLAMLTLETDWQVFSNVSGKGYDVLLSNPKTGQTIKIEAKARHGGPGATKFVVPRREQADFLVGYRLDVNRFYIVPWKELKGRGKNLYYQWHESDDRFQEAWHLLELESERLKGGDL